MHKKYFYTLIICATVFIVSVAGVTFPTRPPVNYTGADGSTCAQCHGNLNTGGGGITADGLPAGTYTSGEQYDFGITLSHPATRGRWGFSIAARDMNNQPVGVFSDSNSNAALNGTELSHFMAVFQTGTSFTYDKLAWTAPLNPTEAQKKITFYFIGNAANGDMGPSGDFIYSDTIKTEFLAVNTPPVITIISPANNSVIPAGSPINLEATANDADGTVTKVAFYTGGIKFLEDSTAPYSFSSSEVEPGIYEVVAKAFDNEGDSTVSDTLRITIAACAGVGSITAEGYTGIPGTALINLASDPDYPGTPDIVTTLPKFEYGPDITDSYGGRIRGYICAPQTGNYTFYISGDDQSELWLSTNDNPANIRRIAHVESGTGFRSWFTYSTQRSLPLRLLKGARYYVETVHKAGTGTDHMSVGWLLPNGVFEGPVAGNRLSPLETMTPAMVAVRTSESFEISLKLVTEEVGNVLEISANPNPSSGSFMLRINSNKKEPVSIKLTDVSGRIIETKAGVTPNSTIEIGKKINLPGIYFIEVLQGESGKRLKLVKK